MQDLCKNECQKEELKSVEIWKRKQSWLERYEEEYDSRNIFRKEETHWLNTIIADIIIIKIQGEEKTKQE